MLDLDRLGLAEFRMEKSRQCLITAQNTISDGDYTSSANRSYYAIFHAIRAIMALDSLDFKKHSAVIGKFRELYIKTGLFDIKYSNIVGEAFELRGDCDYEDFYVVEKQEVEEQLTNATSFVTAAEKYLASKAAE